MSGNGRGVYQGINPTRCISQSGRGAKTYRRIEMHPVCGGAGRSTTPTGPCGMPIASGTTRSIRAGTSGFGWWCAQPFSLCYSGLCPSGFWGNPEGFSPLVVHRATEIGQHVSGVMPKCCLGGSPRARYLLGATYPAFSTRTITRACAGAVYGGVGVTGLHPPGPRSSH
jgi:hypothetical protein